MSHLINELMTEVFVEHPLASAGSANNAIYSGGDLCCVKIKVFKNSHLRNKLVSLSFSSKEQGLVTIRHVLSFYF